MHDIGTADPKDRNESNFIDDIKVSNYQTSDHDVFSVYTGNRHWKRLTPRKGRKTPVWVEDRASGWDHSVSRKDEIWLNNVWENPSDYAKVMRFPRESREIWKNLPRFDPQHVPKTTWLIDSFLAERNIQLVFGERGSFKSTFFLAAATAVANGERFLGLETLRRRVLYLDYENPADVIKARSDCLGLKLEVNENLVVWDRFGVQPPMPDDPQLAAIVRECILETGHGPWIIFDSWTSLLKPGEGGELTGQIAPIYLRLRRLADAGATVTMIDHTKKDDKKRLYGGQDKEAKADSIHNLLVYRNKKTPNNKIVRVETWLKRAAPQGEGSFAFEVQSRPDAKRSPCKACCRPGNRARRRHQTVERRGWEVLAYAKNEPQQTVLFALLKSNQEERRGFCVVLRAKPGYPCNKLPLSLS